MDDDGDDGDVSSPPVVLAAVRVPCAAPSPLLAPLLQEQCAVQGHAHGLATTQLLAAALRDATATADDATTTAPRVSTEQTSAAAPGTPGEAAAVVGHYSPLRWHGSLGAALRDAWVHEDAAAAWAAAPLVLGWRGGGGRGGSFAVVPRTAAAWRPGPTLLDPLSLGLPALEVLSEASCADFAPEAAASPNLAPWPPPDLALDVWALALAAGVPTRVGLVARSSVLPGVATASPAAALVRALWWGALDACVPSRAAALARQQQQQEQPPQRGRGPRGLRLLASLSGAEAADAGVSVRARLRALADERPAKGGRQRRDATASPAPPLYWLQWRRRPRQPRGRQTCIAGTRHGSCRRRSQQPQQQQPR
jgi:hypothetical protein